MKRLAHGHSHEWRASLGTFLIMVGNNWLIQASFDYVASKPEIKNIAVYHTNSNLVIKSLWKQCGKRSKMLFTSIFLLFPQCFLPYERTIAPFKAHYNCRLQIISFRTRLKFCRLRKELKSWKFRKLEILISYQSINYISQVKSYDKGERAELDLIAVSTKPLTHYQTTNFRLFQTERVCRRQFEIWQKWQKVIQRGRKHCGKRRNCSLRAISPFPTVFSKGLFPRGVKRCHCVSPHKDESFYTVCNIYWTKVKTLHFCFWSI